MELFIDTTEYGHIKLRLQDGHRVIGKSEKKTEKISESLVQEIEKLFRREKMTFRDLKKVSVNPGPGKFSSTRTGVATANALNFALGLDLVVLPKYDKEPNITRPSAKDGSVRQAKPKIVVSSKQ